MFKLFNICYIKLYLILSQKIQLNIFLFSYIINNTSSIAFILKNKLFSIY